MKKNKEMTEFEMFEKDIGCCNFEEHNKRGHVGRVFIGILIVPVILALFICKGISKVSLSEEPKIMLSSSPISVTATSKGVISIPSGVVKANPFLPYRDLGDGLNIKDISTAQLVPPPEIIDENSDAVRVMDTIVSGILYDKYSPSAILNIEGNDYLVKKGDVVNNYKVLSILQDSVTVQLGVNTYKAGIGEILTEGTLNHNDVSNLNNKFGGVQQ